MLRPAHLFYVDPALNIVDPLGGAGSLSGSSRIWEPASTQPRVIDALDEMGLGLLIFDAHFRIVQQTDAASRLLGLAPGQPKAAEYLPDLLSRSKLDSSSLAALQKVLASDPAETAGYTPLLVRNSEMHSQLQVRIAPMPMGYRVASFWTEHPEARQAASPPEQDFLTGLLSRRSFEQSVTDALRLAPENPITVQIVNLDRFKVVNDTLGHAAGDALLKLAAERLRSSVRKGDLIARLSGDEFAILLQPSLTQDEPIAVSKRLLDLLQRTYLIDGQLVNIGTSVGMAVSPQDGDSCAVLLKNADLALHHAKVLSRGGYQFFHPSMEERARARRTSELDLRKALALKQLEVFYQPQVDTARTCLVGFEALIRWRHPEKGMIAPNDFLPIAEEIGLMCPIGDWVLRTACRDAMGWPPDVTVAVNASPLQFEDGNFAESVRKALASSGLPGERLEIEITEGMLLRNEPFVVSTLNSLRAMKVRIAMDDFGVGYASLSQLAKFPIDKIKIDRSLGGFDGETAKQRAIVRSITSLGQSLGICTLAEGVEYADQMERLKLDGCQSVQGYLYGRPVPLTQVRSIIDQWHAHD